VSTDHAVAYNI